MENVTKGFKKWRKEWYKVVTFGKGQSIAVINLSKNSHDKMEENSVFFAQDEDAHDFVELYDNEGTISLLNYLDSAGVKL